MKTGITGATGQLGRLVVAELKKRIDAENLVALVRTPGKASDLGVEARKFDYEKPESLLAPLEDIDRLLLISGNQIGKRTEQHKNVITAAKEAGVKWIAYTSLLHADTSSLDLAEEHLATEKMLKESGIAYTLLRNGWYTENYTSSVPEALKEGTLIGSAGEGKISSAARADYAEAAAVVLSGKLEGGKIYELSGDESYTLSDLAKEISRQTGKNIVYKDMPASQYAEVLAGKGLPESLAKAIAGWDAAASRNDLFDESRQLSELIGRASTPLSVLVKKALQAK